MEREAEARQRMEEWIANYPSRKEWVVDLPVEVLVESDSFSARLVEVVLPREQYSKGNLERLWAYYCKKYPDGKDELEVRVYSDRANYFEQFYEPWMQVLCGDPKWYRSFDAHLVRRKSSVLSGDDEIYTYRPDLDKPDEWLRVQINCESQRLRRP